ncbi:DUF6843 domain-containing protein [Priestia endophytica]|uniref:DUF6843 domain-containing protein n=1 Tax=Priestia endophytica TaxID=135735 RepID=UPI000DCA515F|nr:hypothetical protein [Priestia endophytica]RAS74434.1 hypothetical protein A4R27_24120 [Priestia endophytica]
MIEKLLALSFSLFALVGGSNSEKTNDIYLIPEGYEGYVIAFYNVKGAPKIEKEGDYEVHDVNNQGYSVTSTPDMDYGTITDKYYYVDEEGKRNEINKECVKVLSTGSLEIEPDTPNKIEMSYTGMEVTKSQCSQDFMTAGEEIDRDKLDSIVQDITKQYYKSK